MKYKSQTRESEKYLEKLQKSEQATMALFGVKVLWFKSYNFVEKKGKKAITIK